MTLEIATLITTASITIMAAMAIIFLLRDMWP